jgi:hypothetical protein
MCTPVKPAEITRCRDEIQPLPNHRTTGNRQPQQEAMGKPGWTARHFETGLVCTSTKEYNFGSL